jgi:creatinase/prolidase-like protein
MRRGLIRWDADELPVAVLQERMQRLRRSMIDTDCDAIILYTNFIRCAAVAWMTGFSPYWADGILVVPREGEALFATTLSKRMGMWIQTVMPNATVVTSPNPGQLAGKQVAEAGGRRIGIVELDDLPAVLYADLVATLPGVEFVDSTGALAKARSPADQVERKLLGRADAIAQTALKTIDAGASMAGDVVATVEKSARLDGAEEVYIALAADLDSSRSFLRISGEKKLGRRFALRATVAYKGSWVRRTRTVSRDSHDLLAIRRADSWLTELLATIAPDDLHKTIAQQVSALSDGTLDNWFAEGPAGTRPLAVIDSGGAVPAVVLTVNAAVAGVPWSGAGLISQQ